MEKFTNFTSRLAPLPIDHIDTDQVIPARFLKTTSKHGLGDQLFNDWRYDKDGNPNPEFILNTPEGRAAQVLLAGDNFGCGSSREHAPWALTDYGFRAVISTSFADIFRGNALKNSLLPIVVSDDVHAALLDAVASDPSATVTVDLAQQKLTLPDGSAVTFPIDEFSKYCLLEGIDELGYILQQEPAIAAYEAEGRLTTVNTLAAG
jgi:3-isopropylmalate/(R)-2-methylmalate dehydratase small subunit